MDQHPIVVHVTREALPSTQTFVLNQVSHLKRYRPVSVCERRGPLQLSGTETWSAVESAPRPLQWAEVALDKTLRTSLPSVVRARRRYVGSLAPSVVHYHFLVNARSYVDVSKSANTPAIVSAYGYDVSSFPRRFFGLGRTYLARVFSELDLFLAMSEDMRNDLCELGCPQDRVRVHYHGIDTSRFAAPERRYDASRRLRVLCVGRLTPVKGQDRLVTALAHVRKRVDVPFELVLVGDGPLRGRIEDVVARNGMSDIVVFTGHIDHASESLVEHYRHADVFALPSVSVGGRKEGIPGTLVEAMASGLPVVSTRHAGIPTVVESGTNGTLIDEERLAGGDVDELAAALELLLTSAPDRQSLGEAASLRAKAELDVIPATERLEVLYDSVTT